MLDASFLQQGAALMTGHGCEGASRSWATGQRQNCEVADHYDSRGNPAAGQPGNAI